jgi:putative transposase
MVIDVNFDSVILAIVVLNSGLIKLKRFRTPPREILTHNIWIERIQKRYSKSWSFAWSIKRFIKNTVKESVISFWGYTHKVRI